MGDALTHLSPSGEARMVGVGHKPETEREALASAWLTLRPETLACLMEGSVPKGDAAAVARVAGIMAAKRTWELIPLCHPLALSGVDLEVCFHPPRRVEIRARVGTHARTGVEMEALTAVSVAALALYDMLKGLEKGIEIGPIRLEKKRGGQGGEWSAAPVGEGPDPAPAKGT